MWLCDFMWFCVYLSDIVNCVCELDHLRFKWSRFSDKLGIMSVSGKEYGSIWKLSIIGKLHGNEMEILLGILFLESAVNCVLVKRYSQNNSDFYKNLRYCKLISN